jgi:hypothetical protein
MIQLNDVRFNGLNPLKNMNIEEIIAKAYRTGAASNVKRILTLDEIIKVSDKANIYAAKVVKTNSVLGGVVNCDNADHNLYIRYDGECGACGSSIKK